MYHPELGFQLGPNPNARKMPRSYLKKQSNISKAYSLLLNLQFYLIKEQYC